MSKTPHNRNEELLRRLADDTIEDLLSTPREARRKEIEETHGNREAIASEMRALVDNALLQHGKKRAQALRQELRTSQRTRQPSLRSMTVEEKRALYERVANSNAELTMAARDGREIADEDLDTYLAAWLEIGLIDEDGNPS